MAEIGSFGKFKLYADEKNIVTVGEINISHSPAVVIADTLEDLPICEGGGPMKTTASFGGSLVLSEPGAVDIAEKMRELEALAASNEPHDLTIGGTYFGAYVITSCNITYRVISGGGVPVCAVWNVSARRCRPAKTEKQSAGASAAPASKMESITAALGAASRA